MLISVIVPNYNHEKFLRRRIESILAQTYTNFEIIILDDCSTDNSREIIEQYHSNQKVSNIIYNQTNGGSGFKQWLKGIQIAKGEWVWIAESDDWCENNFLEVLVKGVEKNPSCTLAYVQSYCVGDNNEVKWQSNNSEAEQVIDGKKFFEQRLAYGCTIFNASMAIFKRANASGVPQTFTSFKLCCDWLFWINIVRNGNVFITNKVLNYYRRTESSLTSRLYATGYNFIEELGMFQMIKAQKKDDIFFIHDSIFKRYNSFQRKKSKLSFEEAKAVSSAFNNFFGSTFLFNIFLFYKRTNLLFRKIKRKIEVGFSNPSEYKIKTT